MCDYENCSSKIVLPKDYDMNFESISDFKWCMHCNGEVMFVWKKRTYGISLIDGKQAFTRLISPAQKSFVTMRRKFLNM